MKVDGKSKKPLIRVLASPNFENTVVKIILIFYILSNVLCELIQQPWPCQRVSVEMALLPGTGSCQVGCGVPPLCGWARPDEARTRLRKEQRLEVVEMRCLPGTWSVPEYEL